MFLNLIPMVMHWIFYTNIKSGIKVRMQNKKTEIKSCVLVAIVCSVTAKIYANPYSYINNQMTKYSQSRLVSKKSLITWFFVYSWLSGAF